MQQQQQQKQQQQKQQRCQNWHRHQKCQYPSLLHLSLLILIWLKVISTKTLQLREIAHCARLSPTLVLPQLDMAKQLPSSRALRRGVAIGEVSRKRTLYQLLKERDAQQMQARAELSKLQDSQVLVKLIARFSKRFRRVRRERGPRELKRLRIICASQ